MQIPTLAAVKAALAARKAAGAPGPRNLAELARAVGASRQNLHNALSGGRALPEAQRAAVVALLPEIADAART